MKGRGPYFSASLPLRPHPFSLPSKFTVVLHRSKLCLEWLFSPVNHGTIKQNIIQPLRTSLLFKLLSSFCRSHQYSMHLLLFLMCYIKRKENHVSTSIAAGAQVIYSFISAKKKLEMASHDLFWVFVSRGDICFCFSHRPVSQKKTKVSPAVLFSFYHSSLWMCLQFGNSFLSNIFSVNGMSMLTSSVEKPLEVINVQSLSFGIVFKQFTMWALAQKSVSRALGEMCTFLLILIPVFTAPSLAQPPRVIFPARKG